jgi:nicotinamide-nucleotide adenylyltransferase
MAASEIRRRMEAGNRWEDLVPAPVARIISEIDGTNRLKAIAEGGMTGPHDE